MASSLVSIKGKNLGNQLIDQQPCNSSLLSAPHPTPPRGYINYNFNRDSKGNLCLAWAGQVFEDYEGYIAKVSTNMESKKASNKVPRTSYLRMIQN